LKDGDPATRTRPTRPSRLAVALLLALTGAPVVAAGLPVTLTDPDTGARVRLEAGPEALHVVFFATWCPQCIEELDALAELEARWSASGYRLVLVAVRNRQTAERLARFVTEERPPGRLLFDADGSAKASLRVSELPAHLLFDSSGNEKLRTAHYDARIGEEVAAMLEPRRGKKR